MKDVDISEIPISRRVSTRGKQNKWILKCLECEYPLSGKDDVGISQNSYGEVVLVRECPNCFQKQWHHLDRGYLEMLEIQWELESPE